MGKDPVLAKIYQKIHKKMPLTMDDLRYLAQYAPECFEKTCKNVVNSIPEAKPIMEPASVSKEKNVRQTPASGVNKYNIEDILKNLNKLEANEFPFTNVDANQVKNLLGSLYMELLLSQNNKETFVGMMTYDNESLFDRKI